MLVACDDKEFLFIVPGTDWSVIEPPVTSVIVSASSGPLNLSVRLASEEETRYELREHLSAIHRGIASGLAAEGFTVGEGEFEDAPNGHLVLRYEVSATADDGSRVRMVNAWTALRRSDRRYLDFHVSFTAPADDPRWRIPSGMPGPKERLVELADHFVVTDGKGNLPPQ